jgi:HlyD family secretion protein
MLPIKGISDAEYVLAKANADAAKADLEAAKASVLQQQAMLAMAKTNLDYTTIVAPIDGTIIARRVNIGQTVVSSLNAPSLFLLAQDLRRMEVWAAVNEADIARIKQGTHVHFRVDALPEDTFRGTVTQVRLNAAMTQNVVTYTVVITVDNSDLKLLPYLTADVYFEVEEHKDVMLVPNAALRYRPSSAEIEPEPEAESTETPAEKSGPATAGGAPGQGGQRGQGGGRARREADAGRIWQIDPETDRLKAVEVKTGASDLAFTEIITDKLQEGDEIVVGEIHAAAPSGGEVNPLAPPSFRRNRNNPSRNQNKN